MPLPRFAGALALIHCCCVPVVLAQAVADSAIVRVRVMAGDAAVAGASVRTAGLRALTDQRGLALLRLPAGEHLLTTTHIGFEPDTTRVVFRAGSDTTIAITLIPQAAELEGIVVSATRSDRRIEDEPIRVEVVGQEEVDEKLLMTPGDIAMLLNETPGLRVQTTSPGLGGATVRIQGLRGRYTQILSDGLPLYGGHAGSLGMLQIPPMDLRQVEVIKGAASALYGSQALGGVINLVSRRPAESRGADVLLNQTSRGGTDGILFGSTPLARNWGGTLLLGVHRQGREDVDRDGWADLPFYNRGVLRPRVFWEPGDGRSVFLTGGLTIEDRNGGTMPGDTTAEGLPFTEALRTDRLDAGAAVRYPLGTSLLSTRASFTEQRHRHQFGTVGERDRHRTAFAEAALHMPGERLGWVIGAAMQRESYANTDVPAFDFSFSVPSAFASIDLRPVRWLAVAALARVDEHSAFGTLVAPRISALFIAPAAGPLAGWTLRASLGGGVFAPTPLTEETEVTGLMQLDDPGALRAERATTASIDVGGLVAGLEVNATLFRSSVRHALAAADAPPAAVGQPPRIRLAQSPEPARTAGAELLARYVSEPWHVTASYAFTRGTEAVPDSPAVRRRVALVPEHAVGVVGMYEVEEEGRIGIEFYYTGRQALDDNPYRSISRPTVIIGALVERQFGRARVFMNFENLTDTRQTRFDPLLRPARGRGGRWTTDAWTELAGRTVNGGVRLRI